MLFVCVQVLSSSVADRFSTLRRLGHLDNTEAVEEFCHIFDKFFDIWNTRSLEEADRKRKPNLAAFRHDFDERLKVYKLY